jgi:hypothetical protein
VDIVTASISVTQTPKMKATVSRTLDILVRGFVIHPKLNGRKMVGRKIQNDSSTSVNFCQTFL